MEEEKKKRKNKKKKNKQNKTADCSAVGVEQSTSEIQNHVVRNDCSQESETGDLRNDIVAMEGNVGLIGGQANGTESLFLVEAEKQFWMETEATLKEIIRQVEMEKDLLKQKEVTLHECIEQLLKEKDVYVHKEAVLEMEISKLQIEKSSWKEKEVDLEEKVRQLEKERGLCFERVNSNRGIIAGLNSDSTTLQMQVLELEEFRNNLLQENHQLSEKVSSLLLQIQSLESNDVSHLSVEDPKPPEESGSIDTQMEAASALIGKLINENTELIEKVNELYFELDRRSMATEYPSSIGPALTNGTAEPTTHFTENSALVYHSGNGISETLEISHASDPMFQPDMKMPLPDNMRNSLEPDLTDEKKVTDYLHKDATAATMNSPEIVEAEEIVQIPLDESEIHDSSQIAYKDVDGVALTDSPLIGAPFRFAYFVAKYVSGADLINRSH